jgi:hypothetical protein
VLAASPWADPAGWQRTSRTAADPSSLWPAAGFDALAPAESVEGGSTTFLREYWWGYPTPTGSASTVDAAPVIAPEPADAFSSPFDGPARTSTSLYAAPTALGGTAPDSSASPLPSAPGTTAQSTTAQSTGSAPQRSGWASRSMTTGPGGGGHGTSVSEEKTQQRAAASHSHAPQSSRRASPPPARIPESSSGTEPGRR